MLSGVMCLIGMILASVATNIYMVYLGIGLINGESVYVVKISVTQR